VSLETDLTATDVCVVTDADTAVAMGSGDVPVLGTPRLLAWVEAAAVRAVAAVLPAGNTTVGTRVQLEHMRPTPVGGRLTVSARLAHVDGRLLQFEVTAVDDTGTAVGHGQVTRVIVDQERFLSRVGLTDK
jgi:predicted thioesterase